MRVIVTDTIGDLVSDLAAIPPKAAKDMMGCVRDGARAGNEIAKTSAKRTAGEHGKHYHRAFSSDVRRPFFGFGAAVYSAEYGPDAAKRQGAMSFERGSRNQPPHLDLAKSADVIGPIFAREVRKLPDGWFW